MSQATITASTALSLGFNTIWIANNGALTPIFVSGDSSTTVVVGGAAPVGAPVVPADQTTPASVTAAEETTPTASSASQVTSTTAAVQQDSSATETPAGLLIATTTDIVYVTDIVETVTVFDKRRSAPITTSFDSISYADPITASLMSGQATTIGSISAASAPDNTPASTQASMSSSKGEHNQALAIGVAVPLGVIFLAAILFWMLTRRKAALEHRKRALARVTPMGEAKVVSEASLETADPQELEASQGMDGRGRGRVQYF